MSDVKVNNMIKAMETDVAVYHKFILEYKKYDDVLFYFVEGDDFDYYNPRIKEYMQSSESINYICDGKKNVIEARNLISKIEDIEIKKLKFFVDRDYGLDCVPKDIYVTDLYSIENFYVCFESISEIIQDILKINKLSRNFKKCMEYLEKTYKEYSKFAKHMNIFFYTLRKKEKENNYSRTNFNKYKLKKFISNDMLNNYKMNIFDYKQLLKMYDVEYEVTDEDFNENTSLFVEEDHSNFRGKLELQYLKWFLRKINDAIKKGNDDFDKCKTCKYDFSTDVMLLLSKYAITPQSLINYIKLI